MVRYEAADTQITNVRISSSDNKIERMAGFVSWLSDVLNAVKRLQQLQQLDCMYVISLVDVDVEITAHDQWTSVRRELLKDRRQFIEK